MNTNGRRQSRERGPAIGLTVVRATVVLTALLLPASGHSQEDIDQNINEMTQEMLEAVGPDTLLLDKTDNKGHRVTYLHPDLYKDVVNLNFSTTVLPPPVNATRILAVTPPHGPNEEVLILFEASPASAIKCKWVGTDYLCFSS